MKQVIRDIKSQDEFQLMEEKIKNFKYGTALSCCSFFRTLIIIYYLRMTEGFRLEMELEMEKYKSNLKNFRIRKGITQNQLANQTGISRKTIIMIESDEGSNPQISTVKRLMEYFHISFEELYPKI